MRSISTDKSAERSITRSLVETTPKNQRVFMQLYDESQERKIRKEVLYQEALDGECTFTPKLNKVTK